MTSQSEALWAAAPGFPDYQVLPDARVWSKPRLVGRGRKVGGRFLKPSIGSHGYLEVRLSIPGGWSRTVLLHRLVCEAFHGPCPDGMQVRHLDGNPLNNDASNLQWGTPSEDNYDRIRHGTHQYAKRDRCSAGHPLSGDNLSVRNWPDGTFKERVCLQCRREYGAAWRAAKPPVQVTCQTCGETFDRPNKRGSGRVRYCGPECRRIAHNAQALAAQKRARGRRKAEMPNNL